MRFFHRRIVLLGLLVFAARPAIADSLAEAAERAGLSVESQAESKDTGIVIGATRDGKRYVVVFRREASGAYGIEERDEISSTRVPAPNAAIPTPASSPATGPTWSANLATVEASLEKQSQSRPLSIPEGRSLSDGMLRSTRDQVRSWAKRLKAETSPADGYRSIQKSFEGLISDIGWIDVHRFGVPAACDAASIVELSGSRRLMEGALPIMERTLKNAEGGEICYSRALEAYQRLIAPH